MENSVIVRLINHCSSIFPVITGLNLMSVRNRFYQQKPPPFTTRERNTARRAVRLRHLSLLYKYTYLLFRLLIFTAQFLRFL